MATTERDPRVVTVKAIRDEMSEAIFAAHKSWPQTKLTGTESVWHAYADAALDVLAFEGLDAAVERAKAVAEEWNVCDPPTSIPPDAVRAIVVAALCG